VQTEVVHAVVMRETRTRFGAHRLGYLWALIEPIIIILTFYGLGRLANRTAPPGMDIYTFITTGLVPYNLFASCVGRVAESINGNKALLYYPHVQPLDLAIARCLLEAVTLTAVFMVLMGIHALYRQELVFDSLVLTLFGLTLAALLGAVVGLVFCCLGQISNVVDRVRGPLLRPLFWISGVFFTAEVVPGHLRGAALKNPVLHTVELVRAGWFTSYSAGHADPGYVLAWIVVLGLVGLVLERVVRRRIELS
jgi:capsular polysaccharide transport system permease protein